MRLIIAEKPSVGRSIAAVIGADVKKNGCMEGNGYIVSWCIGHLVGLAAPQEYGEQYQKNWSSENLLLRGQQKWLHICDLENDQRSNNSRGTGKKAPDKRENRSAQRLYQ